MGGLAHGLGVATRQLPARHQATSKPTQHRIVSDTPVSVESSPDEANCGTVEARRQPATHRERMTFPPDRRRYRCCASMSVNHELIQGTVDYLVQQQVPVVTNNEGLIRISTRRTSAVWRLFLSPFHLSRFQGSVISHFSLTACAVGCSPSPLGGCAHWSLRVDRATSLLHCAMSFFC
jgi:hypothetical protein